jgi:RHS repeat-associated core domain
LRNFFKKGIIYILLIAVTINSFPIYVLANMLTESKFKELVEEKLDINDEVRVVNEIEEKRKENEKHYLMSDGTMMAAIYSDNVHYEKNGKYIDIDNTLVTTEKGYTLKNSKMDVVFNKESKSGESFTFTNKGYELKWSLVDAELSKHELSKNIKSDIQKMETNETESFITYKNVFEKKDIDVRYDIISNKVEESIIINNKESLRDSFSYNLEVSGLTVKQESKNEITLVDSKGNIIFYIDAPLMYDAANELSDGIVLIPTKTKTGYIIRMELDKEWLNSKTRVYPIVVDPILSTSRDHSHIKDTYIYNGDAGNTTKGSAHILRVGNTNASSSGKKPFRTLIQFTLPELKSGDQVIDAKLNLYNYDFSGSTTAPTRTFYIDVHAVTASWSENSVYWSSFNTKYDSKIIDYFKYQWSSSNKLKQNTANITSIVKEWYSTGNNYGLMLKEHVEANNGTQADAHFISKNTSTTYHSKRPTIYIQYRNQTGLEGYLTTHTQNIGRTTTYTNDYNGNLTLIHSDASTPGGRLPVSIYHVYNSNDIKDNIGYGNGFRLNLNQRLEAKTLSGNAYLIYKDEDGTDHYFYKDGSIWKDEDGLELTITESGTNRIMKDKGGNTSTFIKNGNFWYLRYIDDVNGNRITINYNSSNYNLITSVEDGAGDTITLTYASSLLSTIKDPANRTTTYTYTNKNLTNIKYPDNLNTKYGYNTSHGLINKITNVDGSYINYTYYGVSPYKILRATEYGTDGVAGNSYEIYYGANTTTFKDMIKGNINTYTFNNLGQTLSITSNDTSGSIKDAYGVSYEYGKSTGSTNKLTQVTNMIKSTNNYIINSSAESNMNNWSTSQLGTNQGTISSVNTTSNLGNRSFKIANILSTNIEPILWQSVPMVANNTYTLSAYIKTNVVSTTSQNNQNEGLFFFVEYKKANGTVVSDYYKIEDVTTNFDRYEKTFTLPSDAASNFKVGFTLKNTQGDMYIDNIQLEDGDVANHYNLVDNGNFSNGELGWGGKINLVAADQVVTIDGVKAFRLTGDPTKGKNIGQYIEMDVKKGDSFHVGYWVKNLGVPTDNTKQARLLIEFVKADGSLVQKTEFGASSDSKNWQYVSGIVVAEENYTKIKVTPTYNNNTGNIYYTNIGVYKDVVGTSYKYDTNGNVVSVSDEADQNSTFKYSKDNEMNFSVSPKGRKYIYEYDYNVTNRLLRTFNQAGLEYSYSYDQYGNVISNKVSESNMVRDNIEANKSYYIKSVSANLYIGLNGTNVELTSTPYEWKFEHIEDNLYYIYNSSNKAIEVLNGATADTTNVLVNTKASVDKQKFKLEYNDNGTYMFKTKVTNYASALDIAGALYENGRNIQQYKIWEENNMAQTFQIVDINKEQGKYIESSAEYTTDGRYQTKVIDQRENELITNYNLNTGTVSSIIDSKNNTTSYLYDNMNKVTSISSSNTTNSYTYDKDSLKRITHNGFQYEFIYDGFGNTTSVMVAGNSLIDNYYEARNGYLTHSIYGNNDRIDYTYDTFGRVSTKTNMTDTAKYQYDNRGNLHSLSYNDSITKYTYDLSGRLVKSNQETLNNNYKINYTYDMYNNLSNIKYNLEDINKTINYTYDLDDKLETIEYDDSNINYTYDSLDRLIKKEIIKDSGIYTIDYEYYDITQTKTTSLLKSINNNGLLTHYTYDSIGNITEIRENNVLKYKYYYDSLNQLIKEEDYKINKTTEYTYDMGGNRLSRKVYNNHTGTPTTTNYTYDTTWKDQLKKIDNKNLTYDSIGNVLTYDNNTYTWTNGRELSSITNNNNTYTYLYNDSGIRTSKTVNGITTNYYLEGSNIIYEEKNGSVVYYRYDESGVSGITVGNETYYFVKNIQGDIIELVDEEFNVVATYEYDAWGNVLSVKDSSGNNVTSSTHIGNINPFRYRGYYYDTETKLYYLNSRYYNPELGRFVNADDLNVLFEDQDNVIEHNLYIYCLNNPTNSYDPDGEFALPAFLPVLPAPVIVGFGIAVALSTPEGRDLITKVYTKIKGYAVGAWNGTKKLGEDIYDKTKKLGEDFVKDAKKFGKDVSNGAKNIVEGVVDGYNTLVNLFSKSKSIPQRSGIKGQGKEATEKKKGSSGWEDRSGFRNPRPPKPHTPGRGHRKY